MAFKKCPDCGSMTHIHGECKIASAFTATTLDVANADAAGYRSAMERIAPLVKAVEDLLRSSEEDDHATFVALGLALKEFKDPK